MNCLDGLFYMVGIVRIKWMLFSKMFGIVFFNLLNRVLIKNLMEWVKIL